MTAPEPTVAPKKGRSPGVTAAIIVAIVVILAGGAFVVYKLTDKKDAPSPAAQVATKATAAVASGNTATLRSISTGKGTAQLLALKPADVSGFKITYANCKPFGSGPPTRVCTATRPGGQFGLRLVMVDGAWKINLVTITPTGLPPTSAPATATTTTT
jgi:hypothetical protein